ncbi:MAG: methionine adenosyltransferase [Christensenellaceae bacterium]|jgi:S-adenosylmethionine synthetase|nr:methionine adenosyltransferase [Christensenellaceae bacterium]
MKTYFTSESVTEGHPDKVCDQIADAVLDAIIESDPTAHVACEVIATTGLVLVMGEISTSSYVKIADIARDTIKEIGYNSPEYGFDCKNCAVLVTIDEQSPDIAMGVNDSVESRAQKSKQDSYDKIGAGDQGIMFGYACNETSELMPAPIILAHALSKRLATVRKENIIKNLRPDGKTQVTVEYENGKAVRIDAVVVSTQHDDDVNIETLRKDITKHVIKHVLPSEMLDSNTKIYINPTGRFVIGGPQGDSGLTGRKIIVDTYGGYAPHGGGSFSGKDPTKVDRSATYYARYVAKNIVASGVADKCLVQLGYAIGKANPVSISVNTFGTGKVADDIIANALPKVFDFRPAAIIDNLDLLKPIYKKTASYGHFGRECFSWEKTDKASILNSVLTNGDS